MWRHVLSPGLPPSRAQCRLGHQLFGRVSGVVLFPVFEVTVQFTYSSDFPGLSIAMSGSAFCPSVGLTA